MPSAPAQIRWIREPGTKTKWPVYQKVKTDTNDQSPIVWLSADNKYWNHDFSIVKHYTLTHCKEWRDNLEIERISI